MNDTQWFYENEIISLEEERKYEDMSLIANAAKKSIINMLGLNLIPIKDEETGMYRTREDHEIVPLIMFNCREDIAKEIKDRFEEMQTQEEVFKQIEKDSNNNSELTADDFDNFMNSDLEFVDSSEIARLAIINSPEYKFVDENIINKIEDENKFNKIVGLDVKIDHDFIKDIVSDDKIKIEPETVSKNDSKRKVKITIESEDE